MSSVEQAFTEGVLIGVSLAYQGLGSRLPLMNTWGQSSEDISPSSPCFAIRYYRQTCSSRKSKVDVAGVVGAPRAHSGFYLNKRQGVLLQPAHLDFWTVE